MVATSSRTSAAPSTPIPKRDVQNPRAIRILNKFLRPVAYRATRRDQASRRRWLGFPGVFPINPKEQNLILDRMVVRVWMKLQRELINRQIDWHRVIHRDRHGSIGHVHLNFVLLHWDRKFL